MKAKSQIRKILLTGFEEQLKSTNGTLHPMVLVREAVSNFPLSRVSDFTLNGNTFEVTFESGRMASLKVNCEVEFLKLGAEKAGLAHKIA